MKATLRNVVARLTGLAGKKRRKKSHPLRRAAARSRTRTTAADHFVQRRIRTCAAQARTTLCLPKTPSGRAGDPKQTQNDSSGKAVFRQIGPAQLLELGRLPRATQTLPPERGSTIGLGCPRRRLLRRSLPFVSVMESTNARKRDDGPTASGFSRDTLPQRCVRTEAKVSPVRMIVGDVAAQKLVKVLLVENDDQVQHLPTNRPDPTLGDAVLPRTPPRSSCRLDADRSDHTEDLQTELRVPVEDEMARGAVKREGLAKLLDNPTAFGCSVRATWRVRRRP